MIYARDFRSIRQWRGSQYQAFEELCYQLRDPTPADAELVKTGNPDGGLEWYVTHRNGDQWGWQAKFTFQIDTLLTQMEKSLKTVIKKRPKCLRLTFCIPFDLPDALEKGNLKSARKKYEDRKKIWCNRIPGAEHIHIELWSEGELLERLVNHRNQRGLEWFFWNQEVFSPEWCAQKLEKTLQAVGKRYSPELHVDLPIAFTVEGLALSNSYWRQYGLRRRAVLSAANDFTPSRYTHPSVPIQLHQFSHALEKWKQEVPKKIELPKRIDKDRLLNLTCTCREKAHAVYRHNPLHGRQGNIKNPFSRQDEQIRLRRLIGALAEFESLLVSDATQAAVQGALLLTGEAGQGKTHLFCDASQRAVHTGLPAMIILGGRLSGRNIWSEVAGQFGVGDIGSDTLLQGMQAAAEASNAPFLLFFDALNETDHVSAWQTELPSLLADIKQNPWISIGFSIRSSFRPIVLPPDGLSSIAETEHPGFSEYELEATERFFGFFGIEQPRMPLLLPEFTNPLFLKLYCEGLQSLGIILPPAGEMHVSKIFKRYLQGKERQIVSNLKLDPGKQIVEEAVHAFCQALVQRNHDSLTRDLGASIINDKAPWCHEWPNTLFGQFLSEGILTEDMAWNATAKKLERSVRFTYQRLGDYRVAAAFLKPFNGNLQSLETALAAGKPLRKRILRAPVSWIEALTVLLPEQFNVELLDVVRWHLTPILRRQWERSFVRSIGTRSPSAVIARSRELLSKVHRRAPELQELTLETLLTVAPCPEHPLNANALHCRLMSWSMPTRDVTWSIPTYFAFGNGGALDRLLRWAARGPYPHYNDEIIELASVPLIWTFTSPNRRMRDYATKALAHLLSERLSVLLLLLRRFKGVNDPYVMERLSVVTHGAVLCGDNNGPQDVVIDVAEELRQIALSEEQTPNIITRDAVRGIYEWCVQRSLINDRMYAEVLPPYGSALPKKPWTQRQIERMYNKEKCHSVINRPYGSLLHSLFFMGDFSKYVIYPLLRPFNLIPSRLAKHNEQEPYSEDLGRRWVFKRVLSFGWTPKRFANFERIYVKQQDGPHKAERFGKKYQWIALRELAARVADNFPMKRDFDDQRKIYIGAWQLSARDIDPTLPAPSRKRTENNGFEVHPTFSPDEKSWWRPLGPCYSTDSPVDEGWATNIDDIPKFESCVKKKDKNGTCWIALRACHAWKDKLSENAEYRSPYRRDLWCHIYSWLVKPQECEDLVTYLEQYSLMGRWMPEGFEHINTAYLGELPWAAAAKENIDIDAWSRPDFPHGKDIPLVKVAPTWTEYIWEGRTRDCSIDDSVQAQLPAPILFEAGELNWIPSAREWRTSDDELMAQYRETSEHSVLLVREDWLKHTLEKINCSAVFGWLGEKTLFTTGLSPNVVGDWTQIDAIATFTNAQWHFSNPRLGRCRTSR